MFQIIFFQDANSPSGSLCTPSCCSVWLRRIKTS